MIVTVILACIVVAFAAAVVRHGHMNAVEYETHHYEKMMQAGITADMRGDYNLARMCRENADRHFKRMTDEKSNAKTADALLTLACIVGAGFFTYWLIG